MTRSHPPTLSVQHLGLLPYQEALALQQRTRARVAAGQQSHTLLLLEHPAVYTFGKRGGHELLLRKAEELVADGAELVQTDRGGLVTFHGPGQLVGYPICHLPSLGLSLAAYIAGLLQALTHAVGRFGVVAQVDMDRPGIWVGERKLGAVGVRLRDRVTTHGFAINVATDLSWFDNIVACGLAGVRPTSLAQELEGPPSVTDLGTAVAAELAKEFRLEPTTSGG